MTPVIHGCLLSTGYKFVLACKQFLLSVTKLQICHCFTVNKFSLHEESHKTSINTSLKNPQLLENHLSKEMFPTDVETIIECQQDYTLFHIYGSQHRYPLAPPRLVQAETAHTENAAILLHSLFAFFFAIRPVRQKQGHGFGVGVGCGSQHWIPSNIPLLQLLTTQREAVTGFLHSLSAAPARLGPVRHVHGHRTGLGDGVGDEIAGGSQHQNPGDMRGLSCLHIDWTQRPIKRGRVHWIRVDSNFIGPERQTQGHGNRDRMTGSSSSAEAGSRRAACETAVRSTNARVVENTILCRVWSWAGFGGIDWLVMMLVGRILKWCSESIYTEAKTSAHFFSISRVPGDRATLFQQHGVARASRYSDLNSSARRQRLAGGTSNTRYFVLCAYQDWKTEMQFHATAESCSQSSQQVRQRRWPCCKCIVPIAKGADHINEISPG